jgi:large subunit ribosomal protein L21
MAYAIIRTGGKQFRVEDGQTLRVPSIGKDVNESVELEALLTSDGEAVNTNGAKVAATIVEHGRGDKIIVFKKKRRKQYKRKKGHRQGYTEIKIDSIG